MTWQVASLWVDCQLPPSEVLGAPPEVFEAACRLMNRRQAEAHDRAMTDELRRMLGAH